MYKQKMNYYFYRHFFDFLSVLYLFKFVISDVWDRGGVQTKRSSWQQWVKPCTVLPQTALSRAATAGQRWVRQIAVQDRKLARTTFKNILVLWFNIQYITIWYTDITVKLTNNACRRTLGLGGFKNLPTANIPLFWKVAVDICFLYPCLQKSTNSFYGF